MLTVTLRGVFWNPIYSNNLNTNSQQNWHKILLFSQQEAKDGPLAKLWKKVHLVTSSSEARLRMLNSSQPWAHMADKTANEQHMRRIGSCEWRSLPEDIFRSGLAIALPKWSPYTELISQE